MHEASYDDNGDYYVYSLSQDMEIMMISQSILMKGVSNSDILLHRK
jgi:hypothetical protein